MGWSFWRENPPPLSWKKQRKAPHPHRWRGIAFAFFLFFATLSLGSERVVAESISDTYLVLRTTSTAGKISSIVERRVPIPLFIIEDSEQEIESTLEVPLEETLPQENILQEPIQDEPLQEQMQEENITEQDSMEDESQKILFEEKRTKSISLASLSLFVTMALLLGILVVFVIYKQTFYGISVDETNNNELLFFIQHHLEKGYEKEEIMQSLRTAGRNINIIEQSIQHVESHYSDYHIFYWYIFHSLQKEMPTFLVAWQLHVMGWPRELIVAYMRQMKNIVENK